MDKNESIKCTISQCKYNCAKEPYCSLPVVDIGTHEANPTKVECVDCQSFKLK